MQICYRKCCQVLLVVLVTQIQLQLMRQRVEVRYEVTLGETLIVNLLHTRNKGACTP